MTLNTQLLRDSFELVVTNEPLLAIRFYDRLFDAYPEVAPLFSRTTEERQARMLTEALVAVIDHLENETWLDSTLRAMGARHVGYGVTAPMYDWVGGCLLDTLAEAAGDAWNDELADAWAAAYGAIASLMQAGAREATLGRAG